ncbi:MAG: hypothetical protein RIF39_00115, partial [Cyclobacteriaceae bacterium]
IVIENDNFPLVVTIPDKIVRNVRVTLTLKMGQIHPIETVNSIHFQSSAMNAKKSLDFFGLLTPSYINHKMGSKDCEQYSLFSPLQKNF